MRELGPINAKVIGRIYDEQAASYTKFADDRFAWRYLEEPAFDKYISDLYHPETRVLVIGCGTGTEVRHFISRGVRPENIVAMDVSEEQLKVARRTTKGPVYIQSSIEDFYFPASSVDLVITNTVLHHFDNEVLSQMLAKTYRILKPNGTYFFVEVDPDHSPDGIKPENENEWTVVKTPWETEVPFFNRHPEDLMEALDRHGFDKVSGWLLKVSPEGAIDPENYAKYISHPSRMAARFKKVPELAKIMRENNVQIPSLVETPEREAQRSLVEKYFEAWTSQSLKLVDEIFSQDAVYDEKPGKKPPIVGLDNIKKYWEEHPLLQENILINFKIAGSSGDSDIWSRFDGSFDFNGKNIDINGIIKFTVGPEERKIIRLTEYFETQKTPIY